MGVTLNLTPNLQSFLLLKNSSFYPQSEVKITPKMGLFLLLTWVGFTLFGVSLQDNSFLGVILVHQYLGSFLLLKKNYFNSFLELK